MVGAAQAAPEDASPPNSDDDGMSEDEDSAKMMIMESDVSLPRGKFVTHKLL